MDNSCLNHSHSIATPSPTTVTTTVTVAVLTSKDLEDSCRTPVAITTGAMYAALLPVHGIAMFAFLSKFITSFNPEVVQTNMRSEARAMRLK